MSVGVMFYFYLISYIMFFGMDMTGADFAGVHNFMFSQPYSNASFHTYLNLSCGL